MRGYIPELLSTDAFNVPAQAAKVALFELTTAQAAAADDDGLLAGVTLGSSGAVVKTEFLAAMPYCRNVTITTTGTAGNVKAGTIVVEGKDINGDYLKEEAEVTADSHVAFTGSCAFSEITKVTFPVMDGAVTAKMGWGDKYGVPYMLAAAPLSLGAVDHVNEAITWACDDDEIAKNTFTFSSAPAGETVQIAMFI